LCDRSVSPDRIHQGNLRDNLAVVRNQVDQDIERLWSKRNVVIAPPKKSTVDIQREIAEQVLPASPFCRMSLRAADPTLLHELSPVLWKVS
jgi:hypothetical protein